MVRLFSILIFLLSALITNAQEDLFDLLDDGPQPTQFTYATFKGTKLLNGQTNETPGKGVLQYIISHRFGSFTDEYLYNFFRVRQCAHSNAAWTMGFLTVSMLE